MRRVPREGSIRRMVAALRVLVVDDDEAFRRLLAELLAVAGCELAGEAADGAEAVRLAAELDPDAITMDLELPVLDGGEATAAIRSAGARAAIVVVSGSPSSERLSRAVAAGARCHVPKRDVAALLPTVLAGIAYEQLARPA